MTLEERIARAKSRLLADPVRLERIGSLLASSEYSADPEERDGVREMLSLRALQTDRDDREYTAPPEEQKREDPRGLGFVYFMHSETTHMIKIGFSKDPKRRLEQLKTGHPGKLRIVGVMPDRLKLHEKDLHKRFAKLRVDGGEWFYESAGLWRYIEAHAEELK
jgi:T5orf172 domain